MCFRNFPIHAAAMRGSDGALPILIAWGATGNERGTEWSNIRVVLLTLHQCCLNRSFRRTPLHFASANKHASTCKLLCAVKGVNKRAVDVNGNTAQVIYQGPADESLLALVESDESTQLNRNQSVIKNILCFVFCVLCFVFCVLFCVNLIFIVQ